MLGYIDTVQASRRTLLSILLPWVLALHAGCDLADEGIARADQTGLQITEIVSENTRGMVDDFHAHSDWIEIANRSTRAVNLLDYGLSDDENQPFKWTFPYMILPPGERIVVFASNKDKRDPQEHLHTNFRISATGEAIMLTSPAQRLVDRAPPATLPPNISWGRLEGEQQQDQRGQWRFFFQTTPGETNIFQGWKRLDAFKTEILCVIADM